MARTTKKAEPKPVGRPSKLTPERQRRLLEAIRGGNYYETACAYAGIDYQTLRNWMKRGEEEGEGVYFEFFEAVKKAEADAEVSAVQAIRSGFGDDWRAAMTLLERRYPDRWGRRERMDLQHSGEIGMTLSEITKQAILRKREVETHGKPPE